jgi:uncharacterized protein YkwD
VSGDGRSAGRRHVARPALFALVALATIAVTLGAATPVRATPQSDDLVARVNGLRATNGLPGLTADPLLTSLAQQWAEQMASTGVPAHPPNSYFLDNLSGVGTIADNVTIGVSLDDAWSQLENSPSHRGNMLLPGANRVGIGVATSPAGVVYVHQIFTDLSPLPAAPPPQQAPAPAPSEPEPPAWSFPTETLPPAAVPTPEAPTELPADVLGTTQVRAVNVAVIPPISYGQLRSPVALTTPSPSSSPWVPAALALGAVALVLLILALVLMARARRAA